MNQKTKSAYFFAVVLLLALGFVSITAIAKSDNAKNNNTKKEDKSSASSQSQGKSKDTTVDLKNFKKPDKAKGETNAQIHKEQVEKVIENLEQVADQEETSGNVSVSDEIEQVAEEQSDGETDKTIEEVEGQGKIKTFLLGTDYKNLGQLRSNLVQNRNQIRKLTQTMNQVQSDEEKALIQEQLQILMQERERIKTVIGDNENSFSLLGWVFRFLNGYEETPLNDQGEDELVAEVETAIENTATEENPVDVPIDAVSQTETTDNAENTTINTEVESTNLSQ